MSEDFIHVYSRREAVSDGVQIRIDDGLRAEAGIKFPVFVTQKVWEKYLKVPVEMAGWQNLEGRIWDMLYMFRKEAIGNPEDVLEFEVIFQMPNKGNWERNERFYSPSKRDLRIVKLQSEIGPMDFDDASPAITIMVPGED